MKIIIGIQTCNRLDFTKQCVESILKHNPEAKDMLWVCSDDGSTDGTHDYIRNLGLFNTRSLNVKQRGITQALKDLHTCAKRSGGGDILLYIQNDWAQTRPIDFEAIAKFFEERPNAGHMQTIRYKGEDGKGRPSGSAIEVNNYTKEKIVQGDPILIGKEKILTGNWHYADIPGFTNLKFSDCMFTDINDENERLKGLATAGCDMYLLDNQPYTNLDYTGAVQTPGRRF